MSASPLMTFNAGVLQPSKNPDLARRAALPLAPGTYVAGQILGQITSANVADVQTVTSTLTGGSFKLYLNLPNLTAFTGAIAYSGTGSTYASNIQTALNTLIQTVYPSGSVAVTGTGPFTITFGGTLANQPITLMTVDNTLATGGTATIAHTTTGVGPNGTLRAYASGNSDGSSTPVAICAYPVTVDAAGNVGGIGQWSATYLSEVCFQRGQFYTADLTGLDSTALTNQPGWRLLWGTVTTGELELP